MFAIQLCSIASTELCELVLVGTGEPPAILRQNPNKITILYGSGFGVKKIGLGQKKTLLGQNPNFVRKFVLKAPLMNDGQ